MIEHYSPAIQRLVSRLLAWDQEVEDVVQDVFAAAFAHRKKYRARSRLKTWLFSIAINVCRTRNRRRLLWLKYIKKHQISGDIAASRPDDHSLEQERSEQIRQAVRRLSPKYRDAVVLKYLEELPTEQILEILKINEKTFYTRLNRARNLLQQELSEYIWMIHNE